MQDSKLHESSSKKQGTRVFKKASYNGKITVYLGRRDFVDHVSHVDPIDGVVLVDPEYLKDRKVYGHVLASFRYGREDLDVLGVSGLTFRKDLYLASAQIYPPEDAQKEPLTRLQERLMRKLGKNAYPFFFELPPQCPASVTLQPAPGDSGKPCGIDYELKAFVGETAEDKPLRRNSVRLAIRKVMYAPSKPGEQPSIEVSKEFMMSPGKLHMECSLDKEIYYHGEKIAVNVHIQNNSNKPVKKIKVAVRQFADICLFQSAQYKCSVAELESDEGFPLGSGSTLNKVYALTPLLANNKDKWGLALDGQLKEEDTNLASSSLVTDTKHETRENLAGILVQYKVKVKLFLGSWAGELVAELPFTLMHPKPDEERPSSSAGSHRSENGVKENGVVVKENGDSPAATPAVSSSGQLEGASTNLIELETNVEDDDIIFEDFARLRLRGETEA